MAESPFCKKEVQLFNAPKFQGENAIKKFKTSFLALLLMLFLYPCISKQGGVALSQVGVIMTGPTKL